MTRYSTRPFSVRDQTSVIVDERARLVLSGEFPDETAAEIAAALNRAHESGRAEFAPSITADQRKLQPA